VSCLTYHAGLPLSKRKKAQSMFTNDQIEVKDNKMHTLNCVVHFHVKSIYSHTINIRLHVITNYDIKYKITKENGSGLRRINCECLSDC